MKKICKKEYSLDVEGRIIGHTLGISVSTKGLVDNELRLDKKAAEKIENLTQSMRRVMLSTDRPIDTYIVCARDKDMIGAEYIMTGCLMDIKRVLVLDIPRSQYLKRIKRDFSLSPAVLGESKIKNLFADLNGKTSPELVLLNYAHFLVSTEKIREIFYPAIIIAEPLSISYEITEIQSKEISEDEALFWVKVKELYKARPEAQRGAEIFPPGFINEYLILANRGDKERPIMEIAPKYFVEEKILKERSLDEIFNRYKDLSILDDQGLPKKEIKLGEFLADQTARRLKEKLESEKPFKDNFKVFSVKGEFENGFFKIYFAIEGEEKEILTEAAAILRDTTREYWFEDYEGAEVISTTSGTNVSLSKDELIKTDKKIDITKFMVWNFKKRNSNH